MIDALVGFRFVLSIGSLEMGYKSISGISRKVETHTYQEGGVNDGVHIFAKPVASEGVLTLEKGAIKGVKHPFYMPGEPIEQPLVLIVKDHLGNPAKTYTFSGCMTKSWSVSDFDASRNEVLIDKFEITYSRFIVS